MGRTDTRCIRLEAREVLSALAEFRKEAGTRLYALQFAVFGSGTAAIFGAMAEKRPLSQAVSSGGGEVVDAVRF
jgi:hypothetical protein